MASTKCPNMFHNHQRERGTSFISIQERRKRKMLKLAHLIIFKQKSKFCKLVWLQRNVRTCPPSSLERKGNFFRLDLGKKKRENAEISLRLKIIFKLFQHIPSLYTTYSETNAEPEGIVSHRFNQSQAISVCVFVKSSARRARITQIQPNRAIYSYVWSYIIHTCHILKIEITAFKSK